MDEWIKEYYTLAVVDLVDEYSDEHRPRRMHELRILLGTDVTKAIDVLAKMHVREDGLYVQS